MKVTAIVQARMGSTRLPGKIMLPLHDKTVLGHVITRLQRSHYINEIVVATSNLPADKIILTEAECHQVQTFTGSEQNVLERFFEAARIYHPDLIVRITADCPLIDPGIIDAMLKRYIDNRSAIDYMSNTIHRCFPRGLDVEIFTIDTLAKAYQFAEQWDEKEHVTPYIYRHPEQFRLVMFTHTADYSRYRWTLDTQEDFIFIQEVYRHLYVKNPSFTWLEVIQLMQKDPDLVKINEHIHQKE